jgi:hypothetical protein
VHWAGVVILTRGSAESTLIVILIYQLLRPESQMNLEKPNKPAPDSRDRLGELEDLFKELFARQAGFKRVVPEGPPDSAHSETHQRARDKVRRSTVEADADAQQTKRHV